MYGDVVADRSGWTQGRHTERRGYATPSSQEERREEEGPARVGVPLWDSRRWGERGRGERGGEVRIAAYSILYYSTIVVYQSHTDRYSVFAIRGNHACRALLAQHQK